MIPEEFILSFIDDSFESNKYMAMSVMLDVFNEITPEDMKRKWMEGSKEHGPFTSESIPDVFHEMKREVTDFLNYNLIPRLLGAYKDG